MSKSDKPDPIERPVAAAERALRILDAFASQRRSLTLGELSEETGLFKSVLLRYMISFEKMSYVRRRSGGRYQLDVKALQLGRAFETTFDERETIHAALTRLRDATGESVFFYVREGDKRMCLMGVDSDQSLRVSRKVGVLIQMDVTSISQVLAEFGDGAPPGREVDETMVRWSVGEYDALTASVSAPAFDRDGALTGALAVSGPIGRFEANAPANVARVASEARRLSADLGYAPAPGDPD